MSTIDAFISSVYPTHRTLTYVPTNFEQYPSNFDLRTDKLQLWPTDLLTTGNTQTTLTYVSIKFGQYENYSNLPTYEIWQFGRFEEFGSIKQLGPMNIDDFNISNDLDPSNNSDTRNFTIWTVWTIWTYSKIWNYKLWRFGPLKFFWPIWTI